MDYPYKSQWDSDAAGSHEDCGPACVVSVLGAFGKSALMTDVRAFLGIPITAGTDANQLQRSLQHFGVPSAMVWTGTSYPQLPAICLVKYSGFDRASVWDKQFMGWHWMVVLSMTDAEIVCHDPDWLGVGGRSKRYSRREFDAAFIPYGGSKVAVVWQELNVSNVPVLGTVNSDPFLRLRDNPSLQANVIGVIANGAPVQIIGSTPDNQSPPQVWYHVQFLLSNQYLFADEKMTVKLSSSMQGWCASWLVNTAAPPPSRVPAYSISAAPASIASGQSVVLSMSFENVDGAWLNDGVGPDRPLDGSKQPALQTVTPVQNTVYTLKVKVGAAFDTRTVSVAVTPPPVTPPQPKGTVHLGFHTLGNNSQPAVDAGARFGLVMDGKENNQKYANVGGRSMFRRYRQYPGPIEEVAQDAASLPAGCEMTDVNEFEQMDGSSPAGILAMASRNIAIANRLKQLRPDGAVRVAGLSISCGCPDFTRQDICDAVKQGYADAYNSGLIDIDMHLYSPNMMWIYKGMAVPGIMAPMTDMYTGKVGRNGVESVYYSDAPIHPEHALVSTKRTIMAAAFTDSPTYQDWFETRWHFLFTRCGFDINSSSRVYSGECGVDEGGIGGFRGHGATDQDVVKYFTRFGQLQRADVVINGVAHTSPFGGACFFQLGDTQNGAGHWGSYAMDSYLAALKASGLLV